MSFRSAGCLIALAVGAAHAGDAAPAFVAAQFARTPAPAVLDIRGTLTTNVASILGHNYPDARVTYWRADGKTVWILSGRSKTAVFRAGFVVKNGQVLHADVIEYNERRGRDIRSRRFLRQFDGIALRDGTRELDRRIDGITGATVSVNAVRSLACLALVFDAAAPGAETEQQAGGRQTGATGARGAEGLVEDAIMRTDKRQSSVRRPCLPCCRTPPIESERT